MIGSQWDLLRVMATNLILETEYLPDSASLGIVMYNGASCGASHEISPRPTDNHSHSVSGIDLSESSIIQLISSIVHCIAKLNIQSEHQLLFSTNKNIPTSLFQVKAQPLPQH